MSTNYNFLSSIVTSQDSITRTDSIAAKVDGYFTDLSGLINTYGPTLLTSTNTAAEVRSILEFDLSSLPVDAVITRVRFEGYLAGMRLATGQESLAFSFYGYTGDGAITEADAWAGALVGCLQLDDPSVTGPLSVTLAPDFIQNALLSGFAGLHLRVNAPDYSSHTNYVLLRSAKNSNSDTPPSLVIDFTTRTALTPDACVVKMRPETREGQEP